MCTLVKKGTFKRYCKLPHNPAYLLWVSDRRTEEASYIKYVATERSSSLFSGGSKNRSCSHKTQIKLPQKKTAFLTQVSCWTCWFPFCSNARLARICDKLPVASTPQYTHCIKQLFLLRSYKPNFYFYVLQWFFFFPVTCPCLHGQINFYTDISLGMFSFIFVWPRHTH